MLLLCSFTDSLIFLPILSQSNFEPSLVSEAMSVSKTMSLCSFNLYYVNRDRKILNILAGVTCYACYKSMPNFMYNGWSMSPWTGNICEDAGRKKISKMYYKITGWRALQKEEKVHNLNCGHVWCFYRTERREDG